MFKAICPALLTLFLIWRKFYFDSALKGPISSACLPSQILQNHMDHLSTLQGPFPEFWKEPSKWGVLIIDAWVSSLWICLCFSHIIPLFVLFFSQTSLLHFLYVSTFSPYFLLMPLLPSSCLLVPREYGFPVKPLKWRCLFLIAPPRPLPVSHS